MAFAPRELPICITSKRNPAGGSTIPKGSAVKLSATVDDDIALISGVTDVFYGVAMKDIPAGEFGDIGVIGRFQCLAGGSVTRGTRVGPNAAGKFAGAPANLSTVAGVAERSAALDELFECFIGGFGQQASV